ncbi:MAG: uracil-DNA glycosylase, partial [Azonexus sp.]|nr:uracil-DNA glycosylase [Azonexus sp.]
MRLTREQILSEMGITPLWTLRDETPECSTPHPETKVPISTAQTGQPAAATPQPTPPPSVPATQPVAPEPIAVDSLNWADMEAGIRACRACGLCQQRKQAVPGVGDLQPDWLFIGEGPGAEEDVKGEPFVGQAGKLLDAMLAAIDLQRGNKVYIANAVKCRPPGNRTPEASEMAACRPWLQRQIQLLQPKVIVLLGKAAAHTVLGNDKSLASLRGQRFEYQQIP